MIRRLPLLGGGPRPVELSIDGQRVVASEGETLLEACRRVGVSVPTLCFAENLTPVNVCRLCVVELEGSRTLVPACSRKVEPGMVVHTESPRVKLSRRMVLELLASTTNLSTWPDFAPLADRYGVEPDRFGPEASSWAQPAKVDNELYMRDYSRCVLCYRCVEACGIDAQGTFAIAVAGRGLEARISTELDVPLPDSACVYCGNCIGACPTGAIMFLSEHRMREEGSWDESRQSTTDTICPYCGVGCTLTLHVQDNTIVKVTSPEGSDVTSGHLCVKGRFGFQFVQNRGQPASSGGKRGG